MDTEILLSLGETGKHGLLDTFVCFFIIKSWLILDSNNAVLMYYNVWNVASFVKALDNLQSPIKYLVNFA